jgi:hypothetical protein
MRYGFVAHHAGNEIIPSSRGKKRLYYNDSEFTVDDRQNHRQTRIKSRELLHKPKGLGE